MAYTQMSCPLWNGHGCARECCAQYHIEMTHGRVSQAHCETSIGHALMSRKMWHRHGTTGRMHLTYEHMQQSQFYGHEVKTTLHPHSLSRARTVVMRKVSWAYITNAYVTHTLRRVLWRMSRTHWGMSHLFMSLLRWNSRQGWVFMSWIV